MRWSCPHCGVQLAISDEKLGGGWSFSRCFQCAGYALVRKSEINLIKVDKAPPGEKVILPESTEEPRLSGAATKNLLRTSSNRAPEAPVIRPAAPRSNGTKNITQSMPQGIPQNIPQFPDYLPRPIQEQSVRANRLFPVGIGIAAIMAIGSGVYLYIQGQALWQKSRNVAANEAIHPSSSQTIIASARETGRSLGVPELSDRLHHAVMAPIRDNELQARSTGTAPLMVRAKSDHAHLFSGPGQDFPVLGTVDPKIDYIVIGWNERWFRVTPKGWGKSRDIAIGWVRNDMVQPTADTNLSSDSP